MESIYADAKAAMAIECEDGGPNDCGKFNRYKPYVCTCGAESRRLEALEAVAERIIAEQESARCTGCNRMIPQAGRCMPCQNLVNMGVLTPGAVA